MPLGVEKKLPSDCLNISKLRAINVNTHSDAHDYSLEQELLPKFRNFGREYKFAIKFACLAYSICLKRSLIGILTVWGRSYI